MEEKNDKPIVEVFGLVQMVNNKKILDIPHLWFDTGRVYCIYGPNGSGKTTLFEILTLLRKPTEGRIYFKAQEVYPDGTGIAELRTQVTLVQQGPLLFDTTVEKNVAYGLRIRKVDRATRQKRVAECLDLVGLDGFQKRKARSLSGGEVQRVAIARALSINPVLLLLDEFSANVDQENVAILEKIMSNINQRFGTTILFITHYMNQAYRLSDKVIHLFDGKIVQSPISNVLRGRIERIDNTIIFRNENIRIYVVSHQRGDTRIAVPSEAISVSKSPLQSSIRNCLQGYITHIIDEGSHIQLRVRAGEIFQVKITKESFYEMQLNLGMHVYLNFKASSVEVL